MQSYFFCPFSATVLWLYTTQYRKLLYCVLYTDTHKVAWSPTSPINFLPKSVSAVPCPSLSITSVLVSNARLRPVYELNQFLLPSRNKMVRHQEWVTGSGELCQHWENKIQPARDVKAIFAYFWGETQYARAVSLPCSQLKNHRTYINDGFALANLLSNPVALLESTFPRALLARTREKPTMYNASWAGRAQRAVNVPSCLFTRNCPQINLLHASSTQDLKVSKVSSLRLSLDYGCLQHFLEWVYESRILSWQALFNVQ